MNENVKTFERFQEEHARLHDPALLRGAVELVPTTWNDVISDWSKKSKTGKKKLWKELLRLAEASAGERLLPLEFIRTLRTQDTQPEQRTGKKPKAATRITDKAQGASSIMIEPESVTLNLSPFQELGFTLNAPGAERVELVWVHERETNRQRVAMDHLQAACFETKVGLPDGSYLFAFAVDDYMRPDSRLAHSVVLNQQGLFAPLGLARQQQMFVVTNTGAGDESLLLEAGADWLLPETATIDLEAGKSARVTVRLDVAALRPGLNEALLRFSVRRGEDTVPAGAVHIAVQLEVGGAVPEFVYEPANFGDVRQGMDVVQLRVALTARGRGPLTGMISQPHSGELADFRLDADDQAAARFTHTFQIDSANLPQPLPHRAEAALRVMILSDSFLSNYRLREFDIPYRLIYLRKSLPALSFGTVRVGGAKTLRLDVMRSDEGEIELTVELPPGAAKYLEAYPARPGTYVFRFDAGGLSPGSSVNETVELRDGRSGLRSQIKLLGAVALSADEPEPAVAN